MNSNPPSPAGNPHGRSDHRPPERVDEPAAEPTDDQPTADDQPTGEENLTRNPARSTQATPVRARPVRATSADVLHGPVRHTVLWLALPVLLEQLLSFFVGFYDTWLAGRISAEATSAVGMGAYVGWLVSMVFGLVATGTTALVSRHRGAGEPEAANRVMNCSILLAASTGVLVVGGIVVLAPGLARVLGMTGSLEQVTVRYLRLDGCGHLMTGLTLAGAAALRGAGDMRSPMLILGLVNLLNMVASTALVYGIGPIAGETPLLEPLGIDGIATGTVIARLCGGLLILGGLGRGLSGLKLNRDMWQPDRTTVQRILRIGGPAAFDGGVMWIGQLLFLRVIAGLGGGSVNSAVFAAHIIGVRVEAISYLPATAWGVAAATMIGQSLGARDPRRAVRAGHEAALQCGLLAVVVAAAFCFGSGPIYRLMHADPAVRQVGIPAFRILAFFQIPLMLSIVYVIGLRGAGETRLPLLITLLSTFGVRVPLAWLCGIVLEGGLTGAWIGMCADMLLRAILLAWVFPRQRRTRREI